MHTFRTLLDIALPGWLLQIAMRRRRTRPRVIPSENGGPPRVRNRRAAKKPGASLRPILLVAVLGYTLSKNYRDRILPWGLPQTYSSEHGSVDKSNDSLQLHNGRSMKLHAPTIRGPETPLLRPKHEGVLYFTTEDGKLVEISDIPSDFGKPEHNVTAREVHHDLGIGRPLGGKFADENTLYMADAALGLTRFDMKRKSLELLTSQYQEMDVNGTVSWKQIRYANSVAIGPKSGKIYLTSSSEIAPDRVVQKKKNEMLEYIWDTLHGSKMVLASGKPTGYLLQYDPVSKTTRVLADGIFFANGISMQKDEEYIIVSESLGTNVLKFDLTPDIRKGHEPLSPTEYIQRKALLSGKDLPGYTDNADCVYDGKQSTTICYVAIISEFVGPHLFWENVLPGPLEIFVKAVLMIVPRSWAPKVSPKYAGVVVLYPDDPKRAHEFIQDPAGKDFVHIAGVTATTDNSRLYLGSLTNKYVGVYDLTKK